MSGVMVGWCCREEGKRESEKRLFVYGVYIDDGCCGGLFFIWWLLCCGGLRDDGVVGNLVVRWRCE